MTLDEIYAAAWEDNVFFVEFADMPAAAGDRRDIEALAADAHRLDGSDEPVTPEDLLEDFRKHFLGAIVDLCALGEISGEDRVANCQAAWDNFKEYREKGHFPRVASVRENLGLEVRDPHQLGTF